MSDAAKSLPRVTAFADTDFLPRFAYGDQAQVTVATGVEDGTDLGSGFGRFSGADIPWTVQYDEVLLVLEGELTVETDAGRLTAGPRDCIWLPKGTALRYTADNALVFYAITPANWADEAAS